MIRVSPFLNEKVRIDDARWVCASIKYVLFSILILYILAAMIRLAYFNVTEEERQKTEDGARKYYTGVPVTSAALIFPMIQLIQFIVPADITVAYLL